MNRSEKVKINNQINRLRAKKESLIDEFIGRAEEINSEIKYYKELLKGNDNNE